MSPERYGFLIALLVYTALAMAAAVLVDRALFREETTTIVEPVAHEQDLGENGLLLHRDPDGKLDTPEREHPKGHTPVRAGEVTVIPPPVVVKCEGPGEIKAECPPITVRWDSLRNEEDRTLRVQAYSDDAEVIGGIDVPLEPVLLVNPRRQHGIGVSAFADGMQTARYTYDKGNTTLSAELAAKDGFANVRNADDVTPGIGFTWRFK